MDTDEARARDALDRLRRELQVAVMLADTTPVGEWSPAEWQRLVHVTAVGLDLLNRLYAPPGGFALLQTRSRAHLEVVAKFCNPVIRAEALRLLERIH